MTLRDSFDIITEHNDEKDQAKMIINESARSNRSTGVLARGCLQSTRTTRGVTWSGVVIFLVCLIYPHEAWVSGRNRLIPLDMVFSQTQAFLIVDLSAQQTHQKTALIPLPEKDPFTFSFKSTMLNIKQILSVVPQWSGPKLKVNSPVHVISLPVQRSLQYQYHLARVGARRMMYYDHNPAFTENQKQGQAILLLKGYEKRLGATQASMGSGLLPIRYLDQVWSHLTAQRSPPQSPSTLPQE